jgi:glycerate dehydrogenase
MPENHPFVKLIEYDNVCLTPHMAWGSFESRSRCMHEIANNIEMFLSDKIHNRVDK